MLFGHLALCDRNSSRSLVLAAASLRYLLFRTRCLLEPVAGHSVQAHSRGLLVEHMGARLWVSSLLVVLVLLVHGGSSSRSIFVDSAKGTDDLECGSSWSEACQSLSWVARNLSLVDGDAILMAAGEYSAESLSFPVVSIIGAGSAHTIIECPSSSTVGALAFREGGLLRGVRINHCRDSAVTAGSWQRGGDFTVDDCFFFNCTTSGVAFDQHGTSNIAGGAGIRYWGRGQGVIRLNNTVFDGCGGTAQAEKQNLRFKGGAVFMNSGTQLFTHNILFKDCFLIGLPNESGCLVIGATGTLLYTETESTELVNVTSYNSHISSGVLSGWSPRAHKYALRRHQEV